MGPSVFRAFLLVMLAGGVRAGQIEAPVSRTSGPGSQSGSLGAGLGSPVPIQMTVPSLTAGSVPTLAQALSVAPAPVQPAALAPVTARAAAVPVLPRSVVAPARTAAAGGKTAPAAGAQSPAAAPSLDAGRILFDQGSGKVLDTDLLAEGVYSPEIMATAREAGLVFEATPATLKKMKPGVEYNYVIARNSAGALEMTVGRVVPGNKKEVGVKHVALAAGRGVLYSGGARIDPATGRPKLDFNSGMYSQVGLDPKWAPTPANARSLAAHAGAILGTPVEVVDHFKSEVVDVRTPVAIARRGASRDEGWSVDGLPARRLSGGAFKEVLIHPADASLVIKLFSQMGAKDTVSSIAEKRRETRNMKALLDIGRAPRIVRDGLVELETPATRGKMTVAYIVQERVVGRELGDLLRDPATRDGALKEVRILFDELIAARVKLEDRVKMHENISIGRTGAGGFAKAWVLDAGEVSVVAPRGRMDQLLSRPDPLRAYYDSVLAELSARFR